MFITWHGHSCFKITSKSTTHEVVIVTDPYGDDVGLKTPRLFADIVTISHDHKDHNNYDSVHGTSNSPDPFIIMGPGEFEVKKVLVTGVESFHDSKEGSERGKNTIYRFDLEGVSIVHLGDIGQKELNEKQLEEIVNTDVLMIPIGDKYTIGTKDALNIISQVEPRIIIPMHYKINGLKVDVASPESFAKEFGITKIEPISKLKVNKKDLLSGDREVIFLDKI